MKVAVVRGPSLSKWEMQIYEPLRTTVELLGIGSQGSDHDLREVSFPVVRLPCVGEYLAFVPGGIGWLYRRFGDPQILMRFDRIISGYDLVHTVELGSFYSLQAVRAKQKSLVRAVTITVYENIPFLGNEMSARRRLKEEVMAGVDHFLAANEKAREALLAEGAEERRISVVGQAVDTRRFAPLEGLKEDEHKLRSVNRTLLGRRRLWFGHSENTDELARLKAWPSDQRKVVHLPASADDEYRKEVTREAFGLADDDFVVVSVGRMVWEKGWYDIVRSAHKVQSEKFPTSLKLRGAGKAQSEKRRIRFLFVGEGPERERLEEMVERLGIGDTVVFTGSVPYSQMPEIFRLADAFVHASLPTRDWNEQFGGVLIEAMASGLPIVGTLNGGIVQTVEGRLSSFREGGFIGKGGIFVAPQDFSELAGAILRMAADPKLRQRMGRRNRKRVVEKFDQRVIADKIYRIWHNVLANVSS